MRRYRLGLVIVALGYLSGCAPTRSSQPTTCSADVAAFSRLYGVVRYFYPGDAVQGLAWNQFVVQGVARVRDAHDSNALAAGLRTLFDPVTKGIVILPMNASFPASRPLASGQAQVYWQRIGYAQGVNGAALYQAKRVGRPGVFVKKIPEPGISIDRQRDESAHLLQEETKLFDAKPPAEPFVEFPLGAGLKARVPIVLTDDDAKATPAQQQAAMALSANPSSFNDNPLTLDERLADMVVAWNVYRNFYPYWQEVGVDWDAQLEPLLASIDGAATRERQRNSLRHLVSLVRDGHGAVYDSHLTIGHIAVQVEPIDDGLVVTASANPLASIGDRILSVDGVDLKVWAAKELTQVSGSPQYQRWQLAHAIGGGPVGTSISLGLERDGSRHDVTLAYEKQASQPEPPRPEAISELKDGIWYLDITRASEQAFNSHMDQLSHARVVVVDLRGYPKGKLGLTLLQHLVAQPEHTQWMHLPKYDSPFDKPIGYIDSGWGLAPVAPRITGKIIVLTNGSAISYAESVLGYLNDLHLATIVGAPSAGTNGDIQMFTTPSGYNVVFTGLRVTRHDGVAPYHLRGVTPDVAVSPGLEDIREGRDVVLEKALQVAN